MEKFSKKQLENIQIDYGVVYLNYGKSNERKIGPTKGGGTFEVTQNVRDIEFDGRRGKTKGMQYVEGIDAVLKVVSLAITNADLELSMPFLKKIEEDDSITYICDKDSFKILEDDKYLENVTMFAKKTGGKFMRITLFNAMNESGFSLAAVPNGEGTVNLEINAHWTSDLEDDNTKLFEITNVDTIE